MARYGWPNPNSEGAIYYRKIAPHYVDANTGITGNSKAEVKMLREHYYRHLGASVPRNVKGTLKGRVVRLRGIKGVFKVTRVKKR